MFPLKDNIPTDRFPVITVALILANVLVFVFFQHPTGFDSVGSQKVIKYGAIPYEITNPGDSCSDVFVLQGDRRVLRTGDSQPVCEGQRIAVPTRAGDQTEIKIAQARDPTDPARADTFPTWLTLLTAMFMHGGVLHIAGNMLFLWIFGNNVEDSMGRVRFVAFYLLGGLAAFALQIAISPSSTAPTVGASGAIAAVLGGYILLYPRARVLTAIFIIFFFTFLEIPAVFVLGIWFVPQLLFGVGDLTNPVGGGGGVAYFAHIGGFAFGLLLIRAFATRHKQVPPRLPVY